MNIAGVHKENNNHDVQGVDNNETPGANNNHNASDNDNSHESDASMDNEVSNEKQENDDNEEKENNDNEADSKQGAIPRVECDDETNEKGKWWKWCWTLDTHAGRHCEQ